MSFSKSLLEIVIVGSSPDKIKGSLLRQLNIWYSFKGLKRTHAIYVPLSKGMIHKLREILFSDIAILSGVCASKYSPLILIVRKALGKKTIVDFHGFGWYEEYMAYSNRRFWQILNRALTFMYEFLSYSLADHVIVASYQISVILRRCFGSRKNVHVIENATTPIFEKVVDRLKTLNPLVLKNYLYGTLGIPSDALVLLSPLPGGFISNILALKCLRTLASGLGENVYVVVTGAGNTSEGEAERIVYAGYLKYADYIALMMVCDGVLLPYPLEAVCGGARNKVLEAGYCGKVVFSTRAGMLFTNTKPMMHYYPIDDLLNKGDNKAVKTIDFSRRGQYSRMAEELKRYVVSRHSFIRFKINLLGLLIKMLREKHPRLR